MRRKTFIFGSLTYLALAALSILFYKERTAFIDLAFHLFTILKDDDFFIQGSRFGSCFTKAFPLVGGKIGMSLDQIMKFYSVGFIIYYFSLFSLCVLVFKKYRFGLTLLLFNILMVVHTFYWAQSEFPQGLAMMIMYFAFLSKESEFDTSNRFWYQPINSFLLFALAFFHPLLIIPFAFASVYFYYFKHIDRVLLLKNGIIFFILYLVKKLFFTSAYEAEANKGFDNFSLLFPNYFNIQSNKNFVYTLIQEYYFLIPAFILLFYYFIKEKRYLPLLFILGCFGGYLLLVNVSFHGGGTEQFYIENLYLPLSLFVIIPIVFEIVPKVNWKMVFIPLSLICLVKLCHIYNAHTFYTERVEYIQEFIDSTANNANPKMILSPSKVDQEKLMTTWAMSYEVWLLSTVESNVSRSILVIDQPEKYHWALGENKTFITQWGLFEYDKLPSKYFILKDTSHYQIQK